MFTSFRIVRLKILPRSYSASPRRVKKVPESLQTHTGCVLHVKIYISDMEHHWGVTSQISELFAIFAKQKTSQKRALFPSFDHSGEENAPFALFFLKKNCLSLNLVICAFSGPTGRGDPESFASVVGQNLAVLTWNCPYGRGHLRNANFWRVTVAKFSGSPLPVCRKNAQITRLSGKLFFKKIRSIRGVSSSEWPKG